jgi:hypothetical protein
MPSRALSSFDKKIREKRKWLRRLLKEDILSSEKGCGFIDSSQLGWKFVEEMDGC